MQVVAHRGSALPSSVPDGQGLRFSRAHAHGPSLDHQIRASSHIAPRSKLKRDPVPDLYTTFSSSRNGNAGRKCYHPAQFEFRARRFSVLCTGETSLASYHSDGHRFIRGSWWIFNSPPNRLS